ncbi:allantoate amidohydrolase [Pseudoxanthobacter sp.]|uniref:allantoate amidohydrolase n=1 Tax=Pseudoxanthobacter sp. TaxID=1925742 RepID=UPI002FE0F542
MSAASLFSPAETAALGARAETMLAELAGFTAEPGRVTRLYLTPAHRAAATCVAGWMAAAGLEVSEDALATVHGVLPATAEGAGNRRLLIGSHIDSVIDAGRYDGCLGVVAGILAAEEIRHRGLKLPFAVEVLAFGDEEGVRFPVALSSSNAVAGRFDPATLEARDRDGLSLRQALEAFGCDPARIGEAAADPASVLAYLEVHIEQGPVLEQEGHALGIVTAIAGAMRATFRFAGVAGHAGTVPMASRHDALAGAAELVVAIEAIARAAGGDVVATVGRISAAPGAVNVIPAEAVLSLDLRAGADTPRLRAWAAIVAAAEAIAGRRGLTVTRTLDYEKPTAPCAPALQAVLGQAVAATGEPHPRALMSGAGHDGLAMAALTDIAMLFVRCRGGISHNPAEYASAGDMGLAVAALVEAIVRLGAAGAR